MFHLRKMNKLYSSLIRFDHSYIQSHQSHRSHLSGIFTAEVQKQSDTCSILSPSSLSDQYQERKRPPVVPLSPCIFPLLLLLCLSGASMLCPCGMVPHWLSCTYFRAADTANVVHNKPIAHQNVDLHHNCLLFFCLVSCLCKGANKTREEVLGCSSCTVLCFVSVWNSCIRIIQMWFAKNILNIWKRIWWHFPYKNN